MKKWLAVILATTCLACGDENPEQPVKVNFSILTKYDWQMIEPDSTYADDGFVYSDTTIYSFNPDLSVRTSRTYSLVIITNPDASSPTYELAAKLENT